MLLFNLQSNKRYQADAVLTIYAANLYPYLDHANDDLYISSSRMIAVIYSGISMVTILLALSTAFASYKSASNFVLIHAAITGIFLPVSILVYFSTVAYRYKVTDYSDDYKQMVVDYRIKGVRRQDLHPAPGLTESQSSSGSPIKMKSSLNSFINLIDLLQSRFSCCGVDSVEDWTNLWANYIPASCCNVAQTSTNEKWSQLFHTPADHEFKYCKLEDVYPLSCVVALKEDELSKYAWLSDLTVFMIVVTIANTILSLLLFGLTRTENDSYPAENELEFVGVTAKPRPSQPTIMSIKHRPSVVQTLSSSKDDLSSRAQAVRFNIVSSPRTSISGPSKFSAAARRGSSFL